MRFSLTLAATALAMLLGTALSAPLSGAEFKAKTNDGLRLLSLDEGAEPVWKSEDEKLELMRAGKQFFDITDVYLADKDYEAKNGAARAKAVSKASFPAPSHQTAIKSLNSQLSTSNMQTNLNTLSAYNNRYYKSTTGAQAATWIQSTIKSLVSSRSDITVTAFAHSWGQSSTIVKFAGTSTSSPVTIVGAHMDSINLNSPTSGRAPGMDDDGTGTVNLIEIVRVLASGGFKPSTPLEFHFYSGEEGGLLGSKAVASSYNSKGTKVKAMMELDMTGFFKPGTKEVIALEADYIDSGLNSWLKTAGAAYSSLPIAMDTPCGYACSDHASWYSYGYPTAMLYEAITGNDDPYIHSASDTTSVSGFSWSHSLEFAKLALAFAYEMSA